MTGTAVGGGATCCACCSVAHGLAAAFRRPRLVYSHPVAPYNHTEGSEWDEACCSLRWVFPSRLRESCSLHLGVCGRGFHETKLRLRRTGRRAFSVFLLTGGLSRLNGAPWADKEVLNGTMHAWIGPRHLAAGIPTHCLRSPAPTDASNPPLLAPARPQMPRHLAITMPHSAAV